MQSKSQIDQVLRQKSDAREIPGVVAMAANSKEVIYQGAYGKRDLSKDDAMTTDSVFWIASMSKAITAAAGMQLVEQGKLSLDAPIGTVLPDLASPQVLEGFAGDGTPKLRPAKNPITLRHLMTHTAGFCYDMWNGDMVRYLEKTGLPTVTTCKNDALKTPIMTDPGTRWEYGTNIDFVGKAVEAVSGKRLDAYLRDHLFTPLGMTDTGFKIGDAQRQRQPGAEARDGCDDGTEPHRRTHHDQDDVGGRVRDQRRRSLSRHGQEVGAQLPDQYCPDAGRPQPRQPRLGRACQHLLLDRPVA
jgi:methyl acetate hydrolase